MQFDIIKAEGDKRRYMPLLIIGDESEKMIGLYIDRSDLYVGYHEASPIAVCAVTRESVSTVEIKNLAVAPDYRRQGVGRAMIKHIEKQYPEMTLTLGTGETPSTLRFYRSLGFSYSHTVADFFTNNYDKPIVEEGITLKDMIYLSKDT